MLNASHLGFENSPCSIVKSFLSEFICTTASGLTITLTALSVFGCGFLGKTERGSCTTFPLIVLTSLIGIALPSGKMLLDLFNVSTSLLW
jgi:hypothetical protein